MTNRLDQVAAALGAEVARVQIDERQHTAAALGALESLVAEMETRHAAEVSALRAEMADMRAEIKHITEAQATRPPLRVVASADPAATPLDDALGDLVTVSEQRGRVRAIRAMMAFLNGLIDEADKAVAEIPDAVDGVKRGGEALH